MQPTACSTCDHVHSDTRKHPPYRWRCIKFPILPGFNPVDPDFRPEPPYALCSNINHGHCPCWKRLPDGQMQMDVTR